MVNCLRFASQAVHRSEPGEHVGMSQLMSKGETEGESQDRGLAGRREVSELVARRRGRWWVVVSRA
jgi:hypothetical protein